MDAIRVAKVEDVLCSKSGNTHTGTLHLTTHHLIFGYEPVAELDELWVPYPIVSLVTRLPQTLHGLCPLTIRSRTFETITLTFKGEKDAIDVFESIKELTVATSITQLYAFFYTPNPPLIESNGWSMYSPREEFGRMGVGTRSKAWRFTDINKDYSFCSTYPAKLVVPRRISDTTLQYASKYRSKCRIPVLSYLHWANYGTITRSSQPMVGLTNSRSIQDEKLIEAIFQTHHSPESRAAQPVYGATATNLIIDARPTTNAVANTAKGAGTENMDHYKEAKKAYLGIDNIHTMRDSLAKVVDALRESEVAIAGSNGGIPSGETTVVPVLDRHALRRSGWLRHISAILEGSILIVRNVHINSSHVLIHCSDGWDRTAQLSSIAQLCLDPFYRTIRGFQILIEKDWVSFGHKFLDRCGHLSSEKFFLSPVENSANASGAEAAQAFFASVQNRFVSQNHLKETSPVFHQFLESVRQIQRQFPHRFEFNEHFLRRLYYHLYSCQFGTFLCNSEKERRVGENGPAVCNVTVSVWDFFNSAPEDKLNINPDYDSSLDDPLSRVKGADMGVLLPNPKDVRFWNELYGRTDEEMNGRYVQKQTAQNPESIAAVESSEDDLVLKSSVPTSIPLPPSPSRSPAPNSRPPSASPSLLGKSELRRSISPSPTPIGSSSSTPALGQRTRHESLRGFDNGTVGSAYTLKTQPGSHTMSPRSPSPSVRAAIIRSPPSSETQSTTDLFSSGGMKSMWGKLSFNASAALSAVQDTYVGVTKDFKGLSLNAAPGSDERGGELKSKNEIGTWSRRDENQGDGSSGNYTVATNPWSTTPFADNGLPTSNSRPSLPSAFLDNPWSTTTRSESPKAFPSSSSYISSASQPISSTSSLSSSTTSLFNKSLPPDPTIALPTPPSQPRSREPTLPPLPLDNGSGWVTPVGTIRASSQPSPPKQPEKVEGASTPLSSEPPQASPSSDPLGVGLL
ncbi:protein-tyrosine phosphatase family protein [Abortiporus biennis]